MSAEWYRANNTRVVLLVTGVLAAGLSWHAVTTFLGNPGALVERENRTAGVLASICLEIERARHASSHVPTSVPLRGDGTVFVDGWNRPFLLGETDLEWRITSLGADGRLGGTGHDADMVARYRQQSGARYVCVLPDNEIQTFDFRAP